MGIAEILDSSAASANVGEIAAVASRLGALGEQAQHAHDLLTTRGALDWNGQAAAMFSDLFGQLPGELEQVSKSFRAASSALWTYHNTVEVVLTEARTVASQLDGYEADLASAKRQLSAAVVGSADHARLTNLVNEYQSDVAGAKSRGKKLSEQFDSAATACVAGIGQAGKESIHTSALRTLRNWMDDGLSVADSAKNDIGHALAIVWKMAEQPVVAFYDAAKKFVDDPNWGTFADLMRTYSAVLGEVALVVGAIALIAGTGGGALLLASDVLLTASLVTGGVTIGADAMGMREGKVTAGELGEDVVSEGLGVVGMRAGGEADGMLDRANAIKPEDGLTIKGETAKLDAQRTNLENLIAPAKDGEKSVPVTTRIQSYLKLDEHLSSKESTKYTMLRVIAHGATTGGDADSVYGAYQGVVNSQPTAAGATGTAQ